MASREKESDIQRTILDGLAAMKIWAVRMNSGAMYGSHKGKKWAVRFGRRGMADILTIPHWYAGGQMRVPFPIWLECKRLGEKQTPDQLEFQAEVEAQGHRYRVVHSWEEALDAISKGSALQEV